MPSFDNLIHYNDLARDASHLAGAAIIRAIREAFYGLEGYEFTAVPDALSSLRRFRSSADLLQQAANLYDNLLNLIPDRELQVSEDVIRTYNSTIIFHQNMGGAILPRDITGDGLQWLTRSPISSHLLVHFAEAVATKVASGLREMPLNPEDAAYAHRVASDISVVQMLGLAATKVFDGLRP